MNQAVAIVICLAYIMGLISTIVPWGIYAVLTIGLVLAIIVQQRYRQNLRSTVITTSQQKRNSEDLLRSGEFLDSPSKRTRKSLLNSNWLWIIAGAIAFLASIYFQFRVPQPTATDISKIIPVDGESKQQVVTVRGRVISSPRKTRSEKAQLWLKVAQVSEIVGTDGSANVHQDVTGKLYVTIPLLQATGVDPGELVAITGSLYKPSPATNPGGFDFRAYLARQGSFAGVTGYKLTTTNQESSNAWGLYKIRQRIIRAQVSSLGVPEGPLVSAMVLGRRAVDLSYQLRDKFVQVGLAHVLAASGFHVSLILGVVLTLTKNLPSGARFGFGIFTLIIYVGLTGGSPSVLRAAFMGLAALLAIISQRQVKPLASLVLAATLLLLVNPLWIWDLGFQLSFLATLGLLVTVPSLMKRLDWLPSGIASLVAIPIAASVWTLPLLLSVFYVVSPYTILVNIITAPLVAVITLGGFISAILALISPYVGSLIAEILSFPVRSLIEIVQFFSKLPGNQVAVGAISVYQLVVLYGLIFATWFLRSRPPAADKRKKKKLPLKFWQWSLLLAIAIIIIPLWYTRTSVFQATILNSSSEPVFVIQDRGKVILVNVGDENTARFTVLPFLRQQGINKIDWSIAVHSQKGLSRGWSNIFDSLRVKTFYDVEADDEKNYQTNNQPVFDALQKSQANYYTLVNNQNIELGSTQIKLINSETPIVEFMIHGQSWLLLGNAKLSEQSKLLAARSFQQTQVLWWPGNKLNPELLNIIRPEVAIASSDSVHPDMIEFFQENNIPLFWTGRDGGIQWTPVTGFQTTLESDQVDSSFL
ncbi:competence protein [Hydrocoleum sp. CS-953]|uniref:ComEC/Rec2 family competence protein n=1 Tax=Hydrocoleum sp. CS-953 TaxID=1671698 RepID=UPI000B9C21A7|nr:ComEC/Rec2 family competence protein [Hydrocoleum sp. CS-953]OZH52206.1 competence protein [Hydrocoleum sp. CS-953]